MEAASINHAFEAEKNRKAFLYTCIVLGLFLALAIFYTWPLQIPPVPSVQDLIEINLGNDQEGMGTVQPLVKGDPAPDNQSVESHQRATKISEPPSRTVQADENNDDKDAAPVVKSEKPKDNAKDINKVTPNKPVKNIHPSTVMNPNPAPPKPKMVYKGGNGNGGNGAAEDNGYRNQGYKPGNGDAGSPNGNADSYGNSPGGRIGGSGISMVRNLPSGRRPVHFPAMTDDFNENAKVYVDITVNASGRVTSALIARGTTTSNASIRAIALEKARQLKFPPAQVDQESGTILLNFKLQN